MTKEDSSALINLMHKAEQEKFFGEIVFRFKGGDLYQILKNQSLKLQDLNKEKNS